mmetsp:Transcript_80732/g.216411  ORF Transcript_80732/g.216411 Transcript_80732/m.216411 type:complete len:88 (-) Transcript_80732:1679-1942(-)
MVGGGAAAARPSYYHHAEGCKGRRRQGIRDKHKTKRERRRNKEGEGSLGLAWSKGLGGRAKELSKELRAGGAGGGTPAPHPWASRRR